jgi:hypothetical protein
MTRISSGPNRLLLKAIFLPFGDQAGQLSLRRLWVSLRKPPPRASIV